MKGRIDLIWVGGVEPPPWTLGRTVAVFPRPASLADAITRALETTAAEAWLFWGSRLGPPDPRRAEEALARPGDVWHAGLRLGMGGLPAVIDHVAPTWMLNRDPSSLIEATSWRVSLEACLARTEVLRRLGGVRPEFATLSGAALELGHRYIARGALMRHVPSLLPDGTSAPLPVVPLEDELRFVHFRFGRLWLRWALFRCVATARMGPLAAAALFARLAAEKRPAPPPPLRSAARPRLERDPAPSRKTVSVVIPTVDRYPYLRTLLDQLRRQTVAPLEILVADQTPLDRRARGLAEEFANLPLRVIQLDVAGQCSSRNAAIEASRGDFLLFLDDDDEVPADLIERHLASLDHFRNEVSSGVAEEDGAGPLPEAFRLTRASDVFPTNNSLIVKRVLAAAGLFDLAYERGARADGDLGMRVYLSGALMVLNAEIAVLHHHAPSGGLRTHRARVITYASSRSRLGHRNLPPRTEVYLWRRYFSPAQVREMLWLSVFGTFSARGPLWRRTAKAGVALLLLPHTLWRIRNRSREAARMLETFPRIPELGALRDVAGGAS